MNAVWCFLADVLKWGQGTGGQEPNAETGCKDGIQTMASARLMAGSSMAPCKLRLRGVGQTLEYGA